MHPFYRNLHTCGLPKLDGTYMSHSSRATDVGYTTARDTQTAAGALNVLALVLVCVCSQEGSRSEMFVVF